MFCRSMKGGGKLGGPGWPPLTDIGRKEGTAQAPVTLGKQALVMHGTLSSTRDVHCEEGGNQKTVLGLAWSLSC